jgi:hypothetical protein
MKGTNKTPELKPGEVADAPQQANATELSLEDLSKASAGACVSGAHFKTVSLAMRKAGGDPK